MKNSKEKVELKTRECVNYLKDFLSQKYEELIKRKYESIDKNFFRKINITMANYCEDAISGMINIVFEGKYKCLVDVTLPNKKLRSEGRRTNCRPDIVIFKEKKGEKPEIVALIEVKSQLGYSEIQKPKEYLKKMNKLSRKEKDTVILLTDEEVEIIDKHEDVEKFFAALSFKKEKIGAYRGKIEYTISKDLKMFIVNLMASNHRKKVEKTVYQFKDYIEGNVFFYTLFGSNIWYDSLSEKNLYELDESDCKLDNGKIVDKEIRKEHGFERFISDLIKYLD